MNFVFYFTPFKHYLICIMKVSSTVLLLTPFKNNFKNLFSCNTDRMFLQTNLIQIEPCADKTKQKEGQ